MLPFQITKNVPYPLEDIIYDFSLIERGEKKSKVVVFITQKKKLKIISDFLEGFKIYPEFITLTTRGLNDWFKSQKKSIKSKFSLPFALCAVSLISFLSNSAFVLFFHALAN